MTLNLTVTTLTLNKDITVSCKLIQGRNKVTTDQPLKSYLPYLAVSNDLKWPSKTYYVTDYFSLC